MAIRLIIDGHDDDLKRTFEIDQSVITVGRSKSCHIELSHPELSRRHFMVKFMDPNFYLFDQNSRHGTVLDNIRLEPLRPYALFGEHVIEVPGFTITLVCDGQKPKLERTTAVARQLLDELLQGDLDPRDCPSLKALNRSIDFKFINHKTSFVLGSLPEVDFSVSDKGVAKEHVSFVRDLNGICLNPLSGHQVFINNKLVIEPEIIAHNSIIKVGNIKFIFKDHPDGDYLEPSFNEEEHEGSKELQRPDQTPVSIDNVSKPKSALLKILDKVFLWSFLLALTGTVAILFALLA